MKKQLVLAAVAAALSASFAFALDAHVSKDTSVTPAAAWAVVGDFCGISTWHPAVTKCEMSEKDGAKFRTLTLKDGAKLLEKLISFDANGMSYSYSIEEGPLPVAGYKSTLKVVKSGNGATYDWSGSFDAKGAPDADAVKTITGIYQAGVDSLVQKAGK